MELQAPDKETIRILVVDDERTLRESCASILSGEGYEVSVCGRGDEALQLIRRLTPDIMLLDLFLPDVTGMELLQEAVRLHPSCLVIVMTGKASVESSIDVLRAGAWSYIPKPFSAVTYRPRRALGDGSTRNSAAARRRTDGRTLGGHHATG